MRLQQFGEAIGLGLVLGGLIAMPFALRWSDGLLISACGVILLISARL